MAWVQRSYKWDRTTIAGSTGGNSALTSIKNLMTNANVDWTLDSNDGAGYAIFTCASNPSDGDTLTIGVTTWTWKTSPSGGNEVQIGASASDSLSNMETAINGGSEPVTATHPYESDNTKLHIEHDTSGISGNGLAVSESSPGSWDRTHTSWGYIGLRSVKDTLSNLQYKIWCTVLDDSKLRFCPDDIDATAPPTDFFGADEALGTSGNACKQGVDIGTSDIYVIGQGYNLWIFKDGENASFDWLFICQPYIYSPNRAAEITNITNPSSLGISNVYNETPIRVMFSASHGLSSGDRVTFSGTGIGALDGNWFFVTYVDADEITVDGTSSSGTSSSGSATPALTVTTSAEHHVDTTGTDTTVTGAEGSTNANGSWDGWRISATTFWLDAPAGPSAYSNGSSNYALAGVHNGKDGQNTIARAFFAQTCSWELTTDGCGWRSHIKDPGNYGYARERVVVNELDYNQEQKYAYIWWCLPSRYNFNDTYWPTSTPAIHVPLNESDPANNLEVIGEVYDTLLVEDDATMDAEEDFVGYNWQQFLRNANNVSLWLIYSEVV